MFHLIRFNQDVWLGSEMVVNKFGVYRGVLVDHGPAVEIMNEKVA